jgi:hypothetical protein
MPDIRIETVKKLSLQPGDILHIKVGGDLKMDHDTVTWVPTIEELEAFAVLWHGVLPDDVGAVVTHHLVDEEIVQSRIRVNSWPPKVKNGP